VDFANFMWAEPFAMIVPRPGEEPRRLFAFVYPFQLTVLSLTLKIQCSCISNLQRIESKGLAFYLHSNVHYCDFHGSVR
jgi:hypothetical protein